MSLKVATSVDIRVCDIMSSPVQTVTAGATLREAQEALAAAHVGGLAVVSESGKLVGLVSAQDCLDPRHSDPDAPVEDAMTRVLYALRPGDPMMQAVQLMVSEHIHRVLVVGDNGALVGIVTTMDVLRAVATAAPQMSRLAFVKIAE